MYIVILVNYSTLWPNLQTNKFLGNRDFVGNSGMTVKKPFRIANILKNVVLKNHRNESGDFG